MKNQEDTEKKSYERDADGGNPRQVTDPPPDTEFGEGHGKDDKDSDDG